MELHVQSPATERRKYLGTGLGVSFGAAIGLILRPKDGYATKLSGSSLKSSRQPSEQK